MVLFRITENEPSKMHNVRPYVYSRPWWDLKIVLKGCYILLHDWPARREDYFPITGSTVYPLAFCSTRWVEDKSVADRLIILWPNMIKIFEFWNGFCKSKQPKCKSYLNVKDKITDKLYVAKLHFFICSWSDGALLNLFSG